jgi:hypothetical protein
MSKYSRTRMAALCAALILAAASSPGRTEEPSAEDSDAIEALRSQGIDLSEPQVVEFMFSFQGAQDARRFGKTLASEGFRSKVESGGQDVLVLARKRVPLTVEDIAALRAHFQALAKAAGGQYEGWGIP